MLYSISVQTFVKQTGHKAVVLIDEYDKPMLDVIGTDLEEKNRNTLKWLLIRNAGWNI